ncbi:MAG: riboflavin kinase [Nitrospirota bacterium]
MITIKGQVGLGRKIGRTIGYPTINIPYDGDEQGVFAGKVFVDSMFVLAAIHLGPRPTFDDKEPICEAFLLDWEEEVSPGTMVEVEAYKKIRNIKKFKKLAELKNQISKDVEFVKNWYNSTSK